MSRILKNYDNQITNPYGGSHKGIDIVGKTGKVDDIVAHTKGTVVYCDTTYSKNNTKATGVASWGIRVIIQHAGGYYTAYNHLASVCVKKGQTVSKGQVIGRMGNSGCAFGVHLHWEVMKGSQSSANRIDPTPYINADLPNNSTANKNVTITGDITYQSYDNVKKQWLPEVINDRDYAGVIGHGLGGVRAVPKYGEIFTQAHVLGGNWLSTISSKSYSKNDKKNGNSYSGWYGKKIDGVKIWSSQGYVEYRVHIKGGNWLAWVRKADNTINGYAGIYGKEIDAIQMR